MPENMIRIIKPRCAGKTTSLLKLAKEHGCILVEPTEKHAYCIRKTAESRGFQGISVISFNRFLSDSRWSRAKYLIDELDCCLKSMGVCGYSNTELDNEGNEKWAVEKLPPEGRVVTHWVENPSLPEETL